MNLTVKDKVDLFIWSKVEVNFSISLHTSTVSPHYYKGYIFIRDSVQTPIHGSIHRSIKLNVGNKLQDYAL
jgi:hypothetical protein